jgi:thiamine-monophosphate kinase
MARAGLACLKKNDTAYSGLIKKFIHPMARFDAAAILAKHRVACVMDVSDGLAGDARHMAQASQVTIRFDPAGFLIDPTLSEFCGKYQFDPEIMQLAGGEDYELLFACAPEIFERIKKELPGAFQVGWCVPFSGMLLENCPELAVPFQHGLRKHKEDG